MGGVRGALYHSRRRCAPETPPPISHWSAPFQPSGLFRYRLWRFCRRALADNDNPYHSIHCVTCSQKLGRRNETRAPVCSRRKCAQILASRCCRHRQWERGFWWRRIFFTTYADTWLGCPWLDSTNSIVEMSFPAEYEWPIGGGIPPPACLGIQQGRPSHRQVCRLSAVVAFACVSLPAQTPKGKEITGLSFYTQRFGRPT